MLLWEPVRGALQICHILELYGWLCWKRSLRGCGVPNMFLLQQLLWSRQLLRWRLLGELNE